MNNRFATSNQVAVSRAYLQTVFADRPRLEDVANGLIQQWLDERFVHQALRASTLGIGLRVELAAEGAPTAYRDVVSAADALIERVMQGSAVNYNPDRHVLLRMGDRSPVALTTALTVDDLEQLVNQLAPFLIQRFEDRLAEYWSQSPLQDPLSTRWRIVSEQLRLCLRHARQNPPLGTPEEKQMLSNLYPLKFDRDRTAGPDRFRICLVYAASGARAGEWLTLLVLLRQWATTSRCYVYSPGASLLTLESLDDLGQLLPRHMSRHRPGESIRWVLHESEGNVFDRLALSLLEKQLRDLASIEWSTLPPVSYYKQRVVSLTDAPEWFDAPGGQYARLTEDTLPVWLQTASMLVRKRYSQWLDELAAIQRGSAGASYMDGLDPIHVYARKALQAQMSKDYPREVVIDPDQYALAFTRTQGGTVGWTEKSQRTLTDWALDNPFVSSYASVEIINRVEPGYVPDWWIKIPYLKSLIERVDIGKNYVALLEHKLIDDDVEVQRRRRLFSDQMRVQLPLLALENMIRQLHGFTREGFNLIEAFFKSQVAQRQVGRYEIVARPLAFLTHAGGRAHVARNMFVIGAADAANTPHLLYRPSGAPFLQQFPSRQAVLDSIARLGTPLHDAVMGSLDVRGRALFGNGGFLNPHVQRFFQGDEFDAVAAASPALLSDARVPGDFLAHVFTQNAQALVAQAKQQSQSTEARRWVEFRNDLWQLFNAVLPLIRGPLAMAGWLLQTMHTTQTLVSLTLEGDDAAVAGATAEFIAALAGLLLHPVASLDERLRIPPARAVNPEAQNTPVVARQVTPGLLAAAPMNDFLPLYSEGWASATKDLSPTMKADLMTFRWRAQNAQQFQPSPVKPEFVETQGVTKGLYRVFSSAHRFHLHAHILGELYPVIAVEDGYRIADLEQPARLGPWVSSDSNGHWTFDFKLRYYGGMPRDSTLPDQNELQRRNLDLAQQYARALTDLVDVEEKVNTAFTFYERMHVSQREKFTDQHRQTIRQRYLEQLQEQARRQLHKLDVLKRKNANQPIVRFDTELSQQLDEHVENLRAQMKVLFESRSAAKPSPATRQRWDLELVSEEISTVSRAHRENIESLGTLANLNGQLFALSAQERACLAELAVSADHDPTYNALMASANTDWTPLDWRVKQIQAYQGLILKRRPLPDEYDDFIEVKQSLDLLTRQVMSHKNLLVADALKLAERIELLQEVTHQYAAIQDRLALLCQVNPELFEARYGGTLGSLITDVQSEAEHSQAQWLKARPAPVVRRLPANQRLIVTRQKQVLRGRVRERTPASDNDIVDVVEPIDQEPVGSFQKSAVGDEWDEVPGVRPGVPASVSDLEALLENARTRLSRVDRELERERNGARKSNSPIGVEDGLARAAERMRQCAQEIRQALELREKGGGAPINAQEASSLTDLGNAAKRLIEEGRQLRIAIIKRNRPEAPRIEYLKAQGEIEILRVEGRVKLRRDNDYLEEYLIRDAERTPLAYAHFHYRTPQGPAAAFTAGHLKLPQELYLNFVPVGGQSEQAMRRAYRSEIGSRLAESLFFGVTQSVPRRGRQDYW
ncbi:hypothetical protein POF45_05165 [Pseudomonas sp. 681]|uniref:Uncharacterized protein n=1 Tax=Pseudomonas fungipugnans TaxID=3024217 RepID=A0ABT6QIX2_9PSED|nr:hypothetical protein [Pseudomonas sp. 681]MDI2590827.1 hypothetical protein [Pseudomonas sp. 681]